MVSQLLFWGGMSLLITGSYLLKLLGVASSYQREKNTEKEHAPCGEPSCCQ